MRILFLTPRFPYPPIKGDSLRAYHQLRTLSRQHEITLLSLAETPVSVGDYQHVADLCERVIVVPLPRWRAMLNMGVGLLLREPLQVRYYHSAAFRRQLDALLEREQFDVVHATLIRMLPYVWDLERNHRPANENADVGARQRIFKPGRSMPRPYIGTPPPIVVDLIDSLSLNLQARTKEASGPKRLAYRLEYGRVRAYERAVVRHFPHLTVSSPADRHALGSSHLAVIANGVDLDRFPFADQTAREPETLVFTGNMGYPPNEEAVLWFVNEVWPLLRSQRPNLRFWVVGTNPSDKVRALERTTPGIDVLGQVPDVTTYLHRATIAVCPMRTGSGIQNKVLEAMSAGAPVVATALANRGVRATPGRDLLVAATPQELAHSIMRLLDDPTERAHLAQNGRAFVETHYRWEQHAERLAESYGQAIADSGNGSEGRREIAKIQNSKFKTYNVLMMTDVTGRGGAEKALVDLAVRLDRRRFNVTVCATRSAGNYQPVLDEAGVRTVILNRNSRLETYKLLGLLKLMRRERIHILHTHLFGSNTWGRILGRRAGVPVIIAHEHWSSKSPREVWVDRLLYRLSDRILVPSEASKRMVREMEGIPARNIEVLYNGVDISHFTPVQGRGCQVRQELGLGCHELVVGTVGRLSPEKGGVDVLIRAVERLRESHPNVRLLVVGDGPLRPDLERVASNLGSHAIFTGTRTDIPRLLSAMDIFVLPSLKEAMPIALLEAMAMRLPVIATTVGGVPEIVQDGETGLLVPPGDKAALHAALYRLATDPSLLQTLAAAGQAHVQATFTLDSMVARVESLYNTLADQKIG